MDTRPPVSQEALVSTGIPAFPGNHLRMGYPFLAVSGYKTNLFVTFARDVRALCQRVCTSRAIYYYLPVFIIGFPWSLFVFITFIHAIKQRKGMPDERKQVYFFCSWLI